MFKVINPTTGKEAKSYPTLTVDEMNSKIEASLASFKLWRQTSFEERARVLKAVASAMRVDIENLALLMAEEMGKPISEGRGEVNKAAWCADHYAEHAEAYLKSVSIESDATHSFVQHLPLGPVLSILPWNAPLWLAFRSCAPALMAGNTFLMKHDPHVPGLAQAIADIFQKVGAPSGILQNLPLLNSEVPSAIAHPIVRAVSFTGSSVAGSKVARLAGEHIKPVVLELGGSDPAIVLADADLDKAADAICLSRIINAGQSCIAAKRIIVEEAVYEPLLEKIKARLSALKVGDPRQEDTKVGPIARKDLLDNIARQVQAAIDEGARCLLGGAPLEGDGFFYPVTLLADVNNSMTACREETFGPVAVVLKVSSIEEAMAVANDTEYGLAASIWSADVKRAEQLARNIEAGQVVINGVVKTDPRLPSGGVKRSGIGRELGPHGILEFVNVQQIWIGPPRG